MIALDLSGAAAALRRIGRLPSRLEQRLAPALRRAGEHFLARLPARIGGGIEASLEQGGDAVSLVLIGKAAPAPRAPKPSREAGLRGALGRARREWRIPARPQAAAMARSAADSVLRQGAAGLAAESRDAIAEAVAAALEES